MNRNNVKKILCLLFCFSFLFLSSCSKTNKKETQTKTLKIAVSNLSGNFNPFYAINQGDKKVVNQLFYPVQSRNSNNQLVNCLGSISYEFIGENQTKYFITIKNDLFFSDGTNATIDDIIFFFHFIADASYSGFYKDFYLNDIKGLKEYYYDDENYSDNLKSFKKAENYQSQVNKYISKNYADGIDVAEISGIKRIDDYTCTVLYNSRNINAVSQINALLIPRVYFSSNYVKGDAAKIEKIKQPAVVSGPYQIQNYNEGDDKITLNSNSYFQNGSKVFTKVCFMDLTDKDLLKSLSKGDVDIISSEVNPNNVTDVSKNTFTTTFRNSESYVSLFFNTKKISNFTARRQLIRLIDVYPSLDSKLGPAYYSSVNRPLSIRFKEYPQNAEDYYPEEAVPDLIKNEIDSFNVFYLGNEDDFDYEIVKNISEQIKSIGLNSKTVACDMKTLLKAIDSGRADAWVCRVTDTATPDKFEYYHTKGKMNYCGFSNPEIDGYCKELRNSVGFSNRNKITENLLDAIMYHALECPIYQPRDFLMFYDETFNKECLADITMYDDYDFLITELY